MTDAISSINIFLLRTPFTLAEQARFKPTFESFPFVINGALIGHNVVPVSHSRLYIHKVARTGMQAVLSFVVLPRLLTNNQY